MWAEKISQNLEFKIPTNKLVINSRRDEVQHTYLEPLFTWASSVRKYAFGTEFGKTLLFAAPLQLVETPSDEPASFIDPNRVVELYASGYERLGVAFDAAILADLAQVGYDCEDITAQPLEIGLGDHVQLPHNRVPVALSLKERDLPGITRQHEMSMGMYRALALIIHINYIVMSKQSACIFVDDIGEGLDFERATLLIKLLTKKCKNTSIQIIMSTNDRFIMNEVDLEYWHIVYRNSNKVKILDYDNSKKQFDRFKFLGLSNFDFFSRSAYLETKS
ncbi:AAA family ATPase [Aminobacter anthyllidis]|uniref:AAA family ATPase n=1 Tax=Aminobacter anthyllidis TaxID=1035067 RepID=UPI00313DE9B9